jgi:tripartite ATP-independent transporter DctP family solute receptor
VKKGKLLSASGAVLIAVLLFTMSSAIAGQSQIVMKLGGTAAPSMTHPEYASLLKFRDVVKQETNDRLRVDIYPSLQLGTLKEHIEGTSMGTIEACNIGLDFMTALYPGVGIFSMPYLYRDMGHLQRVLASQAGQAMIERVRRDMKLRFISVLYRGPRHTMNSARPVVRPSDLKGLKVRVPTTPLNLETMKAMGATTIPIDFSELYSALMLKVVDGVENPIDVLYELKGHETMKYLSLTGHMQSPIPIMVNEDFYQKLGPDLQQAIMRAGKAAEDLRLELLKTSEGKALEVFKAAGVQVTEVDLPAFKDATKNVYKQFVHAFGEEMYAAVQTVK